jgi:hypothetical protein
MEGLQMEIVSMFVSGAKADKITICYKIRLDAWIGPASSGSGKHFGTMDYTIMGNIVISVAELLKDSNLLPINSDQGDIAITLAIDEASRHAIDYKERFILENLSMFITNTEKWSKWSIDWQNQYRNFKED